MALTSLRNYALPFVILCLLFGTCTLVTGPDTTVPVADAGPDQSARVGNYVVLDGTASRKGDGDTLTYQWTAHPDNPHHPFFIDNDPVAYIDCFKEGIYKFTLVVNNGIKNSKPDEVVVTVLPRAEVLFEDPALEIAVRRGLRIPTQELTTDNLLSLDSILSVSQTGKITSLEGIHHCKNLRYVLMGHQRIRDITPLRELRKVVYLSLTQNYSRTDITPLAGLTQLEFLDLQSNDVSDITPLSGLTKLRNLNLMTNPITDISPLKDLTELEFLWFDYTPLGDISVISRFTKMESLWMTHCFIEDISALATLINLDYLHLGNNRIRNIDALQNCTRIQRLYMDLNQIEDISALQYLTNLKILDLYSNKITNIEPLIHNTGLRDGVFVDIRNNPLDSLSVHTYVPELISRGVIVWWD